MLSVAVLALVAASGYSGSYSSGPGTTEVVTYALAAVNGAPAPVVTQDNSTIKTEIPGGDGHIPFRFADNNGIRYIVCLPAAECVVLTSRLAPFKNNFTEDRQ